MLFQKLSTLKLADAQTLESVDAAIATLEAFFASTTVLTSNTKKKVAQLGDKSENFCRQTLMALAQNPGLVPPSLDVAGAQADLQSRELLGPRLLRVEQLYKRLVDADFALGSDVMTVALLGYRQLKVTGRAAGLDTLQREVSNRFSRRRSAKAKPVAEETRTTAA